MTTALITGSTAGIGAAFARRLAADGYSLVLVARDKERLRRQATELHDRHGVEATVLRADLATDAGIAAVERRLADVRQPVDLLVNNAGFGHKGRFLDVPLADELTMLKVHCEAVLRLTVAASRPMRERGRGGIVNVASVAAFLPRGTYGASKAWVVQFTQGVARDLAGSGVRLMALCPGFVRTEFHERAGMGTGNIPKWMWLDADKLVTAALADLARGRTVSIPDPRYKALMGAARLAPRGLLGGISSRAGRKYGPAHGEDAAVGELPEGGAEFEDGTGGAEPAGTGGAEPVGTEGTAPVRTKKAASGPETAPRPKTTAEPKAAPEPEAAPRAKPAPKAKPAADPKPAPNPKAAAKKKSNSRAEPAPGKKSAPDTSVE
ncbi:short-chain dehydrogenase [Streptomyces sp. CLI2509]|nr:short-chain dehydrogenase [Streptomyces sp. CLI2509]MYX25022.1 SDR family NAD(P)-dependent oxidoreductase [Streptomyces sp. SID8380]SCD81642.1 Short-chain dehydrogenase [Streptomyces sp. SolWspMP-sol7th]